MAPRKKAKAFTIPKSAKIKAIIKSNAETSPLLKLPIEVQREIFTNVLGDSEIFIKLNYILPDIQLPVGVKWAPGGEWITHGDWSPEALNVLRTCRQIYTIANPIFWSTNRFCFKWADHFVKWLKIRTAHQKRSLRSIRIHHHLDGAQGLLLRTSEIKYLTGVRDLHLAVLHCWLGEAFQDCKNKYNSIDHMFRGGMQGLEKLGTLPLETVEITLERDKLPMEVEFFYLYPKDVFMSYEETEEFQEMFKRMLLDRDPAVTQARLEEEHEDYQDRMAHQEEGSDSTE